MINFAVIIPLYLLNSSFILLFILIKFLICIEPLGHCFGKAGDDITNEITSALILGLFSIIVGIVGSVFYFKNHHLRLLKLYPETFFKAKDKAREASPLLEKDSHGKEVGDGTIQLQQNSRNPFFTMLPVN